MSDHSLAAEEAAFDRGVLAGRLQNALFPPLPATAWTPACELDFQRSMYHSLHRYEADLTNALVQLRRRRAQLARLAPTEGAAREHVLTYWDLPFDPTLRRGWNVVMDTGERDAVRMAALQDHIAHLKWSVREAVNVEQRHWPYAACLTRALRAPSSRPSFVREYASRSAFRDDPPAAGASSRFDPADHGVEWQLAAPTQPWRHSQWRLSWFDQRYDESASGELYAVELLSDSDAGDERTGRVWLLGIVINGDEIERIIDWYRGEYAYRMPNSLVAVANDLKPHLRLPPVWLTPRASGSQLK